MIEALGEAVVGGVACRVLVDAVGSRKPLRQLQAKMKARHIQLYSMLPVGVFRRHMARIDMRNHRKLAVIDGSIGYRFSEYRECRLWPKDLAWHDMMVRLTGPIAIELQAIFVVDWYQESHEILTGPEIFRDPVCRGRAARTLPSGPVFPVENSTKPSNT